MVSYLDSRFLFMVIGFISAFFLATAAIAYLSVRHLRIRRLQTALQVCANREESARATCWQSMMTLAELLRFENPDADKPKQIHRQLVRHVQSSRAMSSDHASTTIEMLNALLDISTHQLGRDHPEAHARMLDASNAWCKARTERDAAEKALTTSRRKSWDRLGASASPQPDTVVPS